MSSSPAILTPLSYPSRLRKCFQFPFLHFPVIFYPIITLSPTIFLQYCGKSNQWHPPLLIFFLLEPSVTFHSIDHSLLGCPPRSCGRQDSSLRWTPPTPNLSRAPVGAISPPGWPYQCPQLQPSLTQSGYLYDWLLLLHILSLMALPFTLPSMLFKSNFTFILSHQVFLSLPLKNLLHLSLHSC